MARSTSSTSPSTPVVPGDPACIRPGDPACIRPVVGEEASCVRPSAGVSHRKGALPGRSTLISRLSTRTQRALTTYIYSPARPAMAPAAALPVVPGDPACSSQRAKIHMAQEKKCEVPAFADLNGGMGAAGSVVLLQAKAHAGYCPLAEARLQDLPEDLRRHLIGVAGERAPHGGLAAVALAPLSGRGGGRAVRYLLIHAGHLPIAGEVIIPPIHPDTGHVAVGNNGPGARDCSQLRVLQVKEDDGRVVYQLHAAPVPQVPENVGDRLAELRNVFPVWVAVEASGVLRLDAAAFERGSGTPFADKSQLGTEGAAGLGLGALEPSGLVFGPDAADKFVEKLLGNNEDGAPYSDGGRTSPYAVQVLVDPVKGAKAGDPMAQVAKAAAGAGRESTGHGVGGDNISAVLGIFAASSAVTGVAAGAVSPAAAFGFFLVMLGGIALAMAGVRAP